MERLEKLPVDHKNLQNPGTVKTIFVEKWRGRI